MKKGNPFTLTFGKQPNEYISRYENTDTILSTFEADNPVSQAYLIEGIRGSGKTVLMTSIANELKKNTDWIVIDLNSTQSLIDDCAMRLVDSCKKFPDLLKQGFNISVAGFGIGVNGNETPKDSISIIDDILSSLKKHHKKVVITIDEVLHDDNMRHFASQFQIFVRKDYPVFLIMTGLYENIYAIQNDPALTFLLRTPKIHLEPLSMLQITKQYAEIFQLDQDKAKNLAQITKGYAFAFQALGLLYYEHREEMELNEILSKLDDMLDDFVYKKIWDSLSRQDKDVVLTIKKENTKVSDICKKLNMTSSVFSKYRERLMKRGIITSPQHGYVSLALPRFESIAKNYE
ncbi:Cdc6-related protein, AAA superfamily ATPase [Butyrivibrio hungatei DSM 14810]|uniref:Cdc6-related protein, AAA superfamily ATPase n=1 Tax=Butyrivibrio hungatei DSM 14810 TaxID=1121132 RepID=A0A1M7RXX0_9FIRM|nr:ATP-binding protein [Butyrivibrio hungatei]SHN51031.1 Cdc6-related protein, AAA superfamily ATPase [Butyrivibrio hungatei DSM 14810]